MGIECQDCGGGKTFPDHQPWCRHLAVEDMTEVRRLAEIAALVREQEIDDAHTTGQGFTDGVELHAREYMVDFWTPEYRNEWDDPTADECLT